jgi:hypothetical protein
MNVHHALRTLLIASAVSVPLFALPSAEAQFHIGISLNIGVPPPELPVYVQPPIPGDGYIWTPGYWAYGDAGYFWVPGTWVLAPEPGYLWTPGYWGFENGYYGWHEGYWGPHIGYYGGVNYGFGYGGIGFAGGEWRGNRFFYNSAVVNFNGGWHPDHDRIYEDREVVVHNTIINVNHVSYNGPGGIDRRPSQDEVRYTNERHVQPTSVQQQHQTFAAQDRSQLAAVNHGRPATLAAPNPAAYHQVAQQHAAAQPISAADRSAGKSFNPNNRGANPGQPTNGANPAQRNNFANPAGSPGANRGAQPNERANPGQSTNGANPAQRNTYANPAGNPGANRNSQPNERVNPATNPGASYSAPRSQTATRPGTTPATHPQQRYQPAPNAQPTQRYQPAPRQQPAPRVQPAPRPQPAPKAPAPQNKPDPRENHR